MKKHISYKGRNIHYTVEGNGNHVMLVHGFGEDASVFDQQFRPPQTPPQAGLQHTLSSTETLDTTRFKFIIPQLPGTGESEMIDDMSMEGMADVLRQISLAEIEGTPLTMLGHSMGGYITLAFAEKYPELLNGFGLIHSTAFADSDEKKATRQKGIDFIKEHGAFEFLKTSTPNLFSGTTKDERPELIDKQIAGLRNFSATALVSNYQGMMARPDRTHILKQTTVLVLFIIGEHDNAVLMADVLKQCHLPEKSYIHILSNSGHMGMLEETEKTNKAINDFLLAI